MHANFNACLTVILAYEGAYVNDPEDPGGATMQGVTQATYDAWCRAHGLGGGPVRRIPAAVRDALYLARYWEPVGADALGAGLDLAVFDYGVNSGPGRALAGLRRADRRRGDADTADRLCAGRLTFLHALGTWRRFGRGWGARVADVRSRSLAMAAGEAAPALLATKAAHASTLVRRYRACAAMPAAVPVLGLAHAGASPWTTTSLVLSLVILGATIAIVVVLAFKAVRHGQAATAYSTLATTLQRPSP